MRTRWGRFGAMMGLLVAIFSQLARRAWWAYRARGLHLHAPRTSVVMPRPAARHTYVPEVTSVWRPVVDQALPVRAVATAIREGGVLLSVAWIDVTTRPDIADLPRVLRSEGGAGDDVGLVGTQWLADHATNQIVLVVTFVEPVSCTWALSFDLPRWKAALERIAAAGELFVAWDELPSPENTANGARDAVITALPARGVLLPLSRPAQLRAILMEWTGRPRVGEAGG